MSFILDALRKSEHARQQATGPVLAEVPAVSTRSRSNTWAIAAIALLVVNLVGAGVWLLQRARHDNGAHAESTAHAASSNAAAQSAPPGTSPGEPASGAKASTKFAAVPPLQEPAEAEPPGRNPLADEVAPSLDPTLRSAAGSVPAGPPAVSRRRPGTVVYQTVPEASGPADVAPAPASAPTPSPSDSLPSADDISARGGLAPLHLDLHVYERDPARRFIFVNSHKYREGDTLQEGPLVEQITPDGAVLSYQGSRFKLTNM